MPSLPSCLRKPRTWMLGLLAAAWLFGLGSFVAADGHFEATLPRQRPEPAGEHNLARFDLGPTVRTSSFFADWSSPHHPLFLVDGNASMDVQEKWASAERDPRPWLEIRWREPHELERVVLKHAGWREDQALTMRRYTLRCLADATPAPRLDVTDNQQAIATHPLRCAGARGLRVDFERNGDDIVRIFEVEAWGR